MGAAAAVRASAAQAATAARVSAAGAACVSAAARASAAGAAAAARASASRRVGAAAAVRASAAGNQCHGRRSFLPIGIFIVSCCLVAREDAVPYRRNDFLLALYLSLLIFSFNFCIRGAIFNADRNRLLNAVGTALRSSPERRAFFSF